MWPRPVHGTKKPFFKKNALFRRMLLKRKRTSFSGKIKRPTWTDYELYIEPYCTFILFYDIGTVK